MADEIKQLGEVVKSMAEVPKVVGEWPIVRKIVGMIEEEIDIYWGISQERRRRERLARTERILKKTERMIEESGRVDEVKEVPAKILQPWMEAASLADDEHIQTMWAALLAASSLDADSVRPSFVNAMASLTPNAAKLLHYMHEHERFNRSPEQRREMARASFSMAPTSYAVMTREAMPKYFEKDGVVITDLSECLSELVALQFVEGLFFVPPKRDPYAQGTLLTQRYITSYAFTDLGWAFIQACQPPKKREPES